MSEFEDHLWREFVREHGDDLAQMSRPAAKHNRRARPGLAAGAGLGLAGAGTALVLVLGATTSSPAFAVTRNHDGTVTVSVNSYSGIAGANARLHQLGIRAEVMTQVPAGCRTPAAGQGVPAPPQGIANAHWTINPRNVPAGQTLVLTPGPEAGSPGPEPSSGINANSGPGGQVWSCRPAPGAGSPAPGTGGNS